MGYQIDIAVSGAGRLGEGLVWDDEDQLLWWVDITGGLIHSYDISSRSNTSYDFGEPVGSIGRREAGGLVVAAKSGFYFFDPASGQKHRLPTLRPILPKTDLMTALLIQQAVSGQAP